MWPNRCWVETRDGWASRRRTYADTWRRKHLEVALQHECPKDERERRYRMVQRLTEMTARLDENVMVQGS